MYRVRLAMTLAFLGMWNTSCASTRLGQQLQWDYYTDQQGYLVSPLETGHSSVKLAFTIPEDDQLPYPGLRGWHQRIDASRNSWFFANDRETAGIHVVLKEYDSDVLSNENSDSGAAACVQAEQHVVDDMLRFYESHSQDWGGVSAQRTRHERIGSNEWLHVNFTVKDKLYGKDREYDVFTHCCAQSPLGQDKVRIAIVLDYLHMLPETSQKYGEVFRLANMGILKSLECGNR